MSSAQWQHLSGTLGARSRQFPKPGEMVVVVGLPAPDPMMIPQSVGRVGSVEQVTHIACVYTDGWLQLCFESGIGGMGGIKCRVRVLDRVGDVVTLRYSGWGPDEIEDAPGLARAKS